MSNSFSSAITVCLVEQAAQGPFVLHGDPDVSFEIAKRTGFDAVELFLPNAEILPAAKVSEMLQRYELRLAAVGTGAGWLLHQYSLTSGSTEVRERAFQFIKPLIHLAGAQGVPAIIGSMQGRHESGERAIALERLSKGLRELSCYAHDNWGTKLLYEPLNRYETNLFNRVGDTRDWLESEDLEHVDILADLFHMNIEEASIVTALQDNFSRIGHIHWADSNRRAMSMGHTDYVEILRVLNDLHYNGYVSAEVFPEPNGLAAAERTISSLNHPHSTTATG
ncbi:TIM barrel protein [Pirellulaceae bacterium SH449]